MRCPTRFALGMTAGGQREVVSMKGKRRSGTSVLSRQKPKKARQKRSELIRRVRLGIIAFSLLVGLGTGFWLLRRDKVAVAAGGGKQAWSLTLKMDGNQPLADAAAQEILAVVRKNLGQGTEAELRRAARLAQQTDSYAVVHLLKTAKNAVLVQVQPRQALLCIEADKLRLVAADGAVYGSVVAAEACPGPVLRGVFSEGRGRFNMRSDMTLALDEEEQAIVREALDLVQLSGTQKLPVAGLEHRRYRGFFITLKDRDVEVAIGRAPFAGKLHKLDDILTKLHEKGEQAQRVELDYQGKAFIKLKKM